MSLAAVISADTPYAFWRGNEAPGAGAAADTGTGAPHPLLPTGSVTWGSGTLVNDGSGDTSMVGSGGFLYSDGSWYGGFDSSVLSLFFRYQHQAVTTFVGRWGSGGQRVFLITIGAGGTIDVGVDGTPNVISGAPAGLTPGAVYDIGLRMDNTTVKLYVNGVQVASVDHAGPTTVGGAGFEIWRQNYDGASIVTGVPVSHVAFWKSALAASKFADYHAIADPPTEVLGLPIIDGEQYPIRVHDGTNWVDTEMRYHDGTTWVPTGGKP